MNRMIYLFVLAVILGAIGGFYFHEGLNEKITYERNTCYELMNNQRTFHNINNLSEVIIYGEIDE